MHMQAARAGPRVAAQTPSGATSRLGASRPSLRPIQQQQQQQQRLGRVAALDWSDPDTQIGALGGLLGVLVGIGTPLFYIIRTERDEDRLEELRALNRATKEETGEYLTDVSCIEGRVI